MSLNLDESCKPGKYYADLTIKEIRVRSVYLVHGVLSGPLSIFTSLTTNNTMCHWWVEIETNDQNVWFCAQFDKPKLSLTQHNSLAEVNREGKRAAGRRGDNCDIRNQLVRCPDNVKMSDVYSWMEKGVDNSYNVVWNNCQDFCDEFCMKFVGEAVSYTPGTGPNCALM